MNHKTLLLSREDIQGCLDMPACLEIVEQVFKAHGEARVVMPPKLSLNLKGAGGWVNAMPAYVGPFNAAGLKWVGGWGGNIERGLPFIMGTILLIEPQTGLLLSVMEGGFITNLRTGAATGIAAKYLAKKDSAIVGLIGAGAQEDAVARPIKCVLLAGSEDSGYCARDNDTICSGDGTRSRSSHQESCK